MYYRAYQAASNNFSSKQQDRVEPRGLKLERGLWLYAVRKRAALRIEGRPYTKYHFPSTFQIYTQLYIRTRRRVEKRN